MYIKTELVLARLFYYPGVTMAKNKKLNVSELIAEYDDNFINSISLKDVKNSRDLKELHNKLERANEIVTSYYEMLYNDYITMINSDYEICNDSIDINTVIYYKSLASKIQKAYSYVLYLITFENPFKFSSK